MWKNFLNFLKFVCSNFLSIILIIIFIISSCYLLTKAQIVNPANFETQEILFFGITLSNWGTWITGIGLIITAFWSIYQYHKSVLRKQQEKAAIIAEDFANTIAEKLSIINMILMDNNEYSELFSKIDHKKLKSFNHLEILSMFDNDKDIFRKVDEIILSDEIQNRYKNILDKLYTEKEQEMFCSNFYNLVESTLNHLEAICINISSQAAGSKYIYQSLHQILLKSIEILSITISSSNVNNFDKYFVNIIAVYNMWSKIKDKDIKKFNKTKHKIDKLHKKANKLNSKVTNEINKLLNKGTETI